MPATDRSTIAARVRSRRRLLLMVSAVLVWSGAVSAQEVGGIAITQLARAVVPTVVARPVQFGLLEVTVAAGESLRYAVPEGMVFQVSGAQVAAWDGGSVTLAAGEGAHLVAGSEVTFQTVSEEDAVFLHFVLAPVGEVAELSAVVAENAITVYRSVVPLPGLEVGAYTFDLTLLEFGARYPVNDPHYRSGGALYYVLSGAGVFTAEGVSQRLTAGSAMLEPFGLVHRWANPYDEAAMVVLANISPEAEPAVVFVD